MAFGRRSGWIRLRWLLVPASFVLIAAVSVLIRLQWTLLSTSISSENSYPSIPKPDAERVPQKKPHSHHLPGGKNHTHYLLCLDPVQRCAPFASRDKQQPQQQHSSAHDYPKTLALADPMLRGGYRNQYMRFASLIAYAVEHDFTQILLPSIRWHSSGHTTVPFEVLWDVNYWNQQASGSGDDDKMDSSLLPRLVEYNATRHTDWNPATGLFHGACPMLAAYFRAPGKNSEWIESLFRNATRPYGVGGGPMLGKLWYDYGRYERRGLQRDKKKPIKSETLERAIANTMRPSQLLESLLQRCHDSRRGSYLALHARVEPEMLVHAPCQQRKVRNVTALLDMLRSELIHNDSVSFDQMFVAVSMPQMLAPYSYKVLREQHSENVAILQDVLERGWKVRENRTIPVFTCGEETVQIVDACLEKIAASSLNFEVALQADVFVGTSVSTWSTSVWKERMFQGKSHNYEFTPTGIRAVLHLPGKFQC